MHRNLESLEKPLQSNKNLPSVPFQRQVNSKPTSGGVRLMHRNLESLEKPLQPDKNLHSVPFQRQVDSKLT